MFPSPQTRRQVSAYAYLLRFAEHSRQVSKQPWSESIQRSFQEILKCLTRDRPKKRLVRPELSECASWLTVDCHRRRSSNRPVVIAPSWIIDGTDERTNTPTDGCWSLVTTVHVVVQTTPLHRQEIEEHGYWAHPPSPASTAKPWPEGEETPHANTDERYTRKQSRKLGTSGMEAADRKRRDSVIQVNEDPAGHRGRKMRNVITDWRRTREDKPEREE